MNDDNQNQQNEAFKTAFENSEMLPLRVRDEVLGTVGMFKFVSEILDLFTTKAISTLVATLTEEEISDSEV